MQELYCDKRVSEQSGRARAKAPSDAGSLKTLKTVLNKSEACDGRPWVRRNSRPFIHQFGEQIGIDEMMRLAILVTLSLPRRNMSETEETKFLGPRPMRNQAFAHLLTSAGYNEEVALEYAVSKKKKVRRDSAAKCYSNSENRLDLGPAPPLILASLPYFGALSGTLTTRKYSETWGSCLSGTPCVSVDALATVAIK